MSKSKSVFHVGFDILDYHDILPDVTEYRQDDIIINEDKNTLDECIWRIEEPEILTPEYKRREVKRVLDTGVWVFIKGEPMWIPPHYYQFLRFFNTGGVRPEFRINRLMDIYEKIRTRKNPKALGDYTIKSRQIGETTMEMNNCLWEVPKMDFGLIGMQSKTRDTVKNSCWRTLIMGWNGMDKWLKDELYSEFVSGENVAGTMKFVKQAKEGDKGKNVMLAYAAGSHNAFDSVSNMRKVVLDEWNKWEEASPYATFLNYEKFIATGTSRKGLFSIISSPADIETKYSAECFDFWQGSNPDKVDETGTTSTRIFRHFTSPLTGIEGFYDRFGDADPNKIYDWIMAKRKSVPKEYRQGEIRAYPLNEEEIFGSFESGNMWSNQAGINKRKVYLMGARFKNEKTKEPIVIYGNLVWADGIKDSKPEFRLSDKSAFDVYDARFGFSYLPENQDSLPNIFNPSNYVENCIGIDSVDKRYAGKSPSNFAMVNHKFLDLKGTGIVKCPTMIYCNRPLPIEIAYEDAIKAAVFLRAKVQVESLNTKVVDYFEDRGYINWMLSKIGMPQNSLIKGDAPSGSKSAFIDDIVAMLDAITNVPVNPDDPYLLELNYFYELLDDVSKFNLKDTHARDLSMAWGQSLLGAAKILFKKIRVPSSMGNGILEHLLT